MPLAVIVYSTGTIFRVIVRTHRQIAAQSFSIAGHLSVGNIPALTSKSIRSGKNIIRNGYGRTLPNMNGIEIPDPYCESELRQRFGIATDTCYTILESPEHASN